MASKVANGDIYPCRAVKLDTSAQNRAILATAGDQIFGISFAGTHYPPWSALQDGKLATAGEEFGMHTWTDVPLNPIGPILWQVTAGGTVTVGDRLASDSIGCCSTTTTTGVQIGGIADQSGSGGDLILVRLLSPGAL